MKTVDESTSYAIRELVGTYRRQLRFARAAELARGRQYLLAESVLCPDGLAPEGADELDLLARIATLRRNYAHAVAHWERALKINPENEDYSQALAFARERLRLQTLFFPVILASMAVVFVLVLLSLGLYLAAHFKP
jgi:tetratricopeptide (TPR) repeat protein